MKIDPAVAAAAKHFGGESQAFASLIQAVVIAEGGPHAIIKAVQCTYPNIVNLDDALDVVCRSAVHHLADYVSSLNGGTPADPQSDRSDFVDFWAKQWAPVGASNDPNNLNANWPGNVLKNWTSV